MADATSAIAGGCTARNTRSCDAAASLPEAAMMAGNRTLSLPSVSALQSLTTMLAGRAFARFQPSRKMRVMRPPPMKPIRLVFMVVFQWRMFFQLKPRTPRPGT